MNNRDLVSRLLLITRVIGHLSPLRFSEVAHSDEAAARRFSTNGPSIWSY
jgi:hypothetical protein